MALAYLNENATSAAAANWSDTTGFADEAELVLSVSSGIAVTSDVDHSSLTSGIHSFEIQPAFNADAGQAGTPFEFDADDNSPGETDQANAFVKHGGPRRFYYAASGGNNLCNNYFHVGTGQSYIEGGTLSTVYVTRGEFYANASTVLTNMQVFGGRGTIDNNATGFTAYTQKGGSWTVKRDGTFIVERGTLILDIPDASPTVSLTVEQGARVIVLQANAIATVNNDGIIDLTRAKRPITLGASTHNQGPYAKLYQGTLNHTITAATFYAGFQDAGDPLLGGF